MARFNQSRLDSQGNTPGTGLAACAALDRQLALDARKALKYKPFYWNGVYFLGWNVMTLRERNAFLSGEGTYEVHPRYL